MIGRELGLGDPYREHISFASKILAVNWGLVSILCLVAGIGFAMLYSAAGGSFEPWATRQITRFVFGLLLMFAVALVDLRVCLKYAYLAYLIALGLLVAVEISGSHAMGAQRWIGFGDVRVQPSELMKIAIVLALARYFHRVAFEDVTRLSRLIVPLVLVGLPAALVLRQPDLGTAVMLLTTGGALFFAAGVRLWTFGAVAAAALAAVPIAWQFLHSYQRQRILTFLDPNSDPLGAGYHILQSKIALGSGGTWGKGFLQGSQSHLNFLPEKQTDFVFTMLAEEFGLVGGLTLLGLYCILLIYGLRTARRCRNQFGRLVALGVSVTFFLYVFINIAMVMGLIPVVGVPLPLISYGGTAMLTLMLGFGLILSVHVHRDLRIGRFDEEE